MNPTEREVSVFRGVVKAVGVYQLVLALTDLVVIGIERADLRRVPIGAFGREKEYLVWFAFHVIAAAVLLWGTDSLCRLAFRSAPAQARDEKRA